MTDLAAALAVPAFAFTGLAALASGMRRHSVQIFGGRPSPHPRPAWLRALGAALLAAGAWTALASWGWALGIINGLGILAPAIGLVALLLTYAPRSIIPLAALAALLALVTVLWRL